MGKFLEQKNVGSWWGGFKQSVAQLNFYMVFMTLVMVAVGFWNDNLSTLLASWGLDIPFWVFGIFIITILVIGLLFEYKVSIPSFYSFWAEQFWKHKNPMKKELESFRKEVAGENQAIREELKAIKNPDWNLSQVKNPMTKRWTLINKTTGVIMGYQDDEFVGVPKIESKKTKG